MPLHSDLYCMNLLFWRMHGEYALRITLNQVPANMTLPKPLRDKAAALPVVWMGDEEMFVGKGAAQLNAQLMRIKSDVEIVYTLLLANYAADITAPMVRDIYKDMQKGRYGFSIDGLTRCMRERSVKRVRLSLIEVLEWYRALPDKTEPTREANTTVINNVAAFLAREHNTGLLAEATTIPLLNRLADFIKTKNPRKLLMGSYIARNTSYVVSALREAHARGMVEENHTAGFVYKFIRNRHTFRLSSEHLDYMAHHDWTRPVPPMPESDYQAPARLFGITMQHVVDTMLLSCYTGFHYADRQELSDRHLHTRAGKVCIKKVRRKTRRYNATAIQNVHPAAQRIITKYGGLSGLPRLNYRQNRRYLIHLGKMMALPIQLTTGIGRNTFFDLVIVIHGKSVEKAALMGGLLSTATLRSYMDLRDELVADMDWERPDADTS